MNPRFVTSFSFALKEAPTALQLEVFTGTLTAIVGPNNSGKSLAIREIVAKLLPSGEATEFVTNVTRPPNTYGHLVDEMERLGARRVEKAGNPFFDLRHADRSGTALESRKVGIGLDSVEQEDLSQLLLGVLHTLVLHEGAAESVLDSVRIGDLKSEPESLLALLFRNPTMLVEIQSEVRSAFGLIPVLDYTDSGQLHVRFSSREPPPCVVRRELSEDAADYFRTCRSLGQVSRGTRSFTGHLFALLGTTKRIVVLDEPEAYLHPELARRLGQVVGRVLTQRNGQGFVATHSSSFLMGCLESVRDTTIVRFGPWGACTANTLNTEAIRGMMTNARLRSTGVLSALFAPAAIVVEGDSDRVFYTEVVRRANVFSGATLLEPLVISAGTWQGVAPIVRVLRSAGVPTAAVVDFDTLLDTSSKFSELLKAVGFGAGQAKGLAQHRGDVAAGLRECPDVKTLGTRSLAGKLLRNTEDLLVSFKAHGLFVVPTGAVESWVASHAGDKSEWLGFVLEQFEVSALAPGAAEAGAVAFLAEVLQWLERPVRGMNIEN